MTNSRAGDHSFHLFAATLAALILGGLVGLFFGPTTDVLGEVSKLVVQGLKAVAVPLLFFAIVDALARAGMTKRGFGYLLLVASINGLAAVAIGLFLVNLIDPAQYLTFLRDGLKTGASSSLPAAIDGRKAFLSLVPESLVEPFVSGSTPAVIMIALALGLAMRHLSNSKDAAIRETNRHAIQLVSGGYQLMITIIGWLVYAVPLAVFCAVAKAVGKSGLSVAFGLGIFVAVSIGGMLLQVFGTYQSWILIHPRLKWRAFWRAARDPVAYAFGINSSLATMPMTLGALKKMEIGDEPARLSACIGTNFNNDGILLYEVVAALILAQVFGQSLTLSHQLFIVMISLVATVGVAGFPEAGLVALTLVLGAINVPSEAIVILMSVDWIIARTRSATNVMGDLSVAVAIDRLLVGSLVSVRTRNY